MFELSTDVSNPKQLREGDYSAYDALYLGDFSCPEYPNNFSSHAELLEQGLELAHAQGKKAYLRLYAVPSNHELPWVREHIEQAVKLPFDGLEVHNMGLLRVLREMGNRIPIHLGVFGNLYTHETARVVKDYGVTRVYPNPELSLKEIAYIKDHTPIDVLVPVHGKIPLVISETCFIVEHTEGCDAENCGYACASDHWLQRGSGDWSLKDTGRMTISGKDLCMVEHARALAEQGFRHFYVAAKGETADYAGRVGRIYRQALEQAFSGQEPTDAGTWLDQLGELSRMGLCNGYYFEGAGQRYIGRQ